MLGEGKRVDAFGCGTEELSLKMPIGNHRDQIDVIEKQVRKQTSCTLELEFEEYFVCQGRNHSENLGLKWKNS